MCRSFTKQAAGEKLGITLAVTMVRRRVDASNEAVEKNDQEDEINEVEVFLKGAERKKITTIMKLVSPMIDGASSILKDCTSSRRKRRLRLCSVSFPRLMWTKERETTRESIWKARFQ
jgi:hypothetical protein